MFDVNARRSVISIIVIILAGTISVPVLACPDCGNCKYWSESQQRCVKKSTVACAESSDCGTCQQCNTSTCECYTIGDGCENDGDCGQCRRCSGCYCSNKQCDCQGCPDCGACQVCDNCSCVNTCTDDCKECVDGECVPKSEPCHSCVDEQWTDDCTACQECVDEVCEEKDCGDCGTCNEGNGNCEDDDTKCSGCQTCDGGSCEDDDTQCSGCQTCSGGSCVDDQGKCSGCQTCSGGGCVDDQGKCSGCQTCSGGSCVDDQSKCSGCQTCSGGSCGDDQSKCPHPCKHCVNGNCVWIDPGLDNCQYSSDCQQGYTCENCNCVFNQDPNDANESPAPETKADPVVVWTGEHRATARDLYFAGRGIPIEIIRTYRSRNIRKSAFGYGWDMNYNMKINKLKQQQKLVLLNGRGMALLYTYVEGSDPNKYVSPPGRFDYIIEETNGSYTLHKKHGAKLCFLTNGRLWGIFDRNNNQTVLYYDGNWRIRSICSICGDLGREIKLSYDTNGYIDEIEDPCTGRVWDYDCDSAGDLVRVEDPNGLATTYTYSDHKLKTINDAKGAKWLENFYDSHDRVDRQTYGTGDFLFDYSERDSNRVTVTDRSDVNTLVKYNEHGQALYETVYAERPTTAQYTTSFKYDLNRLMTEKKLPSGRTFGYTYDSNGNVLSVTDVGFSEPNITVSFTYDPKFQFVTSVTDPCDYITYFDYNNTNGNLEEVISPMVQVINESGQLVWKSPTVEYTYNGYGQVETVTAPDGIVTKYQYYNTTTDDPNYGRVWKVIADYNTMDGLNVTTEYRYDFAGNVIEVNDPCGFATEFEYNENNKVTQITDPCSYIMGFAYDKCKMLKRMARQVGGQEQVFKYTYDLLDHLKTVTDPCNYVTTYSYDASENLTEVKDAELNETKYEYDDRGLLWKVTDANNGVTEFTYDMGGQLSEVNDPNGDVTTFLYSRGRLRWIKYPDNSNEQFWYDWKGNVTKWQARDNSYITYKYNSNNWLTEKKVGYDPTIYFYYDSAGRLRKVVDGRSVGSGGGTTIFKYDRLGRLIETNDINSRVVESQYDQRGLRKKLVYPDDSYVTYQYDALGRLERIKDVNGDGIVEYEYDELGRRTEVNINNGLSGVYTWEDANIFYRYDIADNLKKVTNNMAGGIGMDPNGTVDEIRYYYNDYDKVGNRKEMRYYYDRVQAEDINELYSYDYDVLYQLTQVDIDDGQDLTSHIYVYDSLGNRTDSNEGTEVSYSRNKLNQYTEVNSLSYGYDDNGNLSDDGYNSYSYDTQNRLTSAELARRWGPDLVTNGKFNGSANGWTLGSGGICGWEFVDVIDDHVVFWGEYSCSTNLEQNVDGLEAGETYRVTYQVKGQPTGGQGSVVIELGGTEGDAITLAAGTYTQYITTANATGNLKFKGTGSSTGDVFQVHIDNISVERAIDGDAQYRYDYAGRRTKKVTTDALGEVGSETTVYCYDGPRVIAEYDGSNNLLRKFIYGPGIDEVVCMIDVADDNEIYYYHYDGLTSVVALSKDNGEVAERYTYTAFGGVTIRNAADEQLETSNVNNPYMFTGRRYDAETGLYYYRNRHYSSNLGRFVQVDPIGYFDGLGLYTYVKNNPLNKIDPYGLWGRDVHRTESYVWGIMAGLGDVWSEQVAVACQATDTLRPGGTGPLPWGVQSRHFDLPSGGVDSRLEWARREKESAQQAAQEGNWNDAMQHLGRGLHSLQDYYAHRRWDPTMEGDIPGVWRHPEWYDDMNDPVNARAIEQTERASIEYLKEFMDFLCREVWKIPQ